MIDALDLVERVQRGIVPASIREQPRHVAQQHAVGGVPLVSRAAQYVDRLPQRRLSLILPVGLAKDRAILYE